MGELLDTRTFPPTTKGMNVALAWPGRRTEGDLTVLWVIEGIGSYGVGLGRIVAEAGQPVVEAARMANRSRQGIGKSDPVDVSRIATALLPMPLDRLREPRLDEGNRAALQILLTTRDGMTRERTRAVNALTALVQGTDLGVLGQQVDYRRVMGGCPPSAVWRR